MCGHQHKLLLDCKYCNIKSIRAQTLRNARNKIAAYNYVCRARVCHAYFTLALSTINEHETDKNTLANRINRLTTIGSIIRKNLYTVK